MMNRTMQFVMLVICLSLWTQASVCHAEKKEKAFARNSSNWIHGVTARFPSTVVKTNMALWGAGISNVGVEMAFKKRFSIDIPFIYSPYTIRRNWNFKILALQPEFRYWLNERMSGHFVGAHFHVGFFNVAWNGRDRYQGRGGNSPLWGFGVSYGYAMTIYRDLGVEFTIGGGYARALYDAYYNMPKGMKYESGTKNYWGITRVGINLVYRIKK